MDIEERESITSLVETYSDELHSYLCRYTGDYAMAKDVLGDVFLKLVQMIRHKRKKDIKWRPWLYRVATNCAISRFRKQKVRSLFHLKEISHRKEGPKTPHELVEISREGKMVRNAILKLGKIHRSVLVMRVYQEMTYKEIADSLEINVGTVKSRINEAKSRLKKQLEIGYE